MADDESKQKRESHLWIGLARDLALEQQLLPDGQRLFAEDLREDGRLFERHGRRGRRRWSDDQGGLQFCLAGLVDGRHRVVARVSRLHFGHAKPAQSGRVFAHLSGAVNITNSNSARHQTTR